MSDMPRGRKIELGDRRSAMRRFLEGPAQHQGGAYIEYDQQYRTLWRAAELGLITKGDDGYGYGGRLTDKGRAWLASDRK